MAPLHFAVLGQSPRVIAFLAQRGVRMNPLSSHGAYTIDLALLDLTLNGRVQTLDALRHHGSCNTSDPPPKWAASWLKYVPPRRNVNPRRKLIELQTQQDYLGDSLTMAIEDGNLDHCSTILANPVFSADERHEHSLLPSHCLRLRVPGDRLAHVVATERRNHEKLQLSKSSSCHVWRHEQARDRRGDVGHLLAACAFRSFAAACVLDQRRCQCHTYRHTGTECCSS
jgi:hypothetical protein